VNPSKENGIIKKNKMDEDIMKKKGKKIAF